MPLKLLKPHEVEWLGALKVAVILAVARTWQRACNIDWIKTGTVLTALGTFALAGLAYHQANVTQSQLDEQSAEQRPWVWANIDPTKKPTVTGLAKGLAFTFPIGLKNAGHLPATNVAFITRMLADEPPTAAKKNAAVYETCYEQRQASVSGFSLFPDQSVEYAERMAFLPEAALYYQPHGEARVKRPSIIPYMLACIVYRDSAGRAHHTPYVFIIGSWDHKIPGVHSIPSRADELQKTDFGIWPWDWNLVDPD